MSHICYFLFYIVILFLFSTYFFDNITLCTNLQNVTLSNMSHLVYITLFGETDGVTLSRLEGIKNSPTHEIYVSRVVLRGDTTKHVNFDLSIINHAPMNTCGNFVGHALASYVLDRQGCSAVWHKSKKDVEVGITRKVVGIGIMVYDSIIYMAPS